MNVESSTQDEIGIIGCCLVKGQDSVLETLTTVKPEMLQDIDCRQALQVLASMSDHNEPIDLITFGTAWVKTFNRSIPQEILTSTETIPSAYNLPCYLESVLETHNRRKLMLACQMALQATKDKTIELSTIIADLEKGMELKTKRDAGNSKDGMTASFSLMHYLEHRFELHGALSGISSGFRALDRLTSGFQSQELTVIGAGTSVGKSAIAGNIFENAVFNLKVPSLMITFEMPIDKYNCRIMSSRKDIPLSSIRDGQFTERDFPNMTAFVTELKASGAFYEQCIEGANTHDIAAMVRLHKKRNGIKLVIVDYLQKVLAVGYHEKRTYEVGSVSSALKAIAVNSDVAMIALCQLNESRERGQGAAVKPRAPRIADLADSAQIARDADAIILMDRPRTPEDPQGTQAVLYVSKQRDGELGVVPLVYDGAHCRFREPPTTTETAAEMNEEPQSSGDPWMKKEE